MIDSVSCPARETVHCRTMKLHTEHYHIYRGRTVRCDGVGGELERHARASLVLLGLNQLFRDPAAVDAERADTRAVRVLDGDDDVREE